MAVTNMLSSAVIS